MNFHLWQCAKCTALSEIWNLIALTDNRTRVEPSWAKCKTLSNRNICQPNAEIKERLLWSVPAAMIISPFNCHTQCSVACISVANAKFDSLLSSFVTCVPQFRSCVFDGKERIRMPEQRQRGVSWMNKAARVSPINFIPFIHEIMKRVPLTLHTKHIPCVQHCIQHHFFQRKIVLLFLWAFHIYFHICVLHMIIIE